MRRLLVLAGACSLLVGGMAPNASAAPPACDGRPATIVVPDDVEHVQGTEGEDVIHVSATRSVPRVEALGGDDVICTGPDVRGRFPVPAIDAGPGNDVIDGEGYLAGGEGDDRVVTRGRTVNTVVIPGPGDDTVISRARPGTWASFHPAPLQDTTGIVVDAVAGTVDGPAGHDVFTGLVDIAGTYGPDLYRGSAGPDRFSGLEGADVVLGRGGDDVIEAMLPELVAGGAGDDEVVVRFGGRVTGGPGDDTISTFLHGNGQTNHAAPFDLAGGAGRDAFVVAPWTDDGTEEDSDPIPGHRWRGVVAGGAGFDLLRLDPRAPASLRASLRTDVARFGSGRAEMHGIQGLVGGRRDDVLAGDRVANVLLGGRGRDVTLGGPGRDICRAEVRRSCERR